MQTLVIELIELLEVIELLSITSIKLRGLLMLAQGPSFHLSVTWTMVISEQLSIILRPLSISLVTEYNIMFVKYSYAEDQIVESRDMPECWA